MVPYAISTKKNRQTTRNESVIVTENSEKANLKLFKRLKTPQMSEGTRNRRVTRAGSLREIFESNIHMIEKTVCPKEKDNTLDVPVNLQNDRVYIVKERN